jgi:hypothetical protein
LILFLYDLAQPLNTKTVRKNFTVQLVKFENFWGSGFGVMNFYAQLPEFAPFDMLLSLSVLTCVTSFVQMAAPMFLEYGTDGTIRTDGLHWEGFPCLAWEALSAAGYTVPPIYEVAEFERLGVPCCRVTVTMPLT